MPIDADELRRRINIADVIRNSTPLREHGDELIGPCTLCGSDGETLIVSEPKQTFECTECGSRGDVFKFLGEASQSTIGEAIDDLARHYPPEPDVLHTVSTPPPRRTGRHLHSVDGNAALDVMPAPSAEGLPLRFSEHAMAENFAIKHADECRYVHTWGSWMLWDGSRWKKDDLRKAFNLCRSICKQAADEAANTYELGAKMATIPGQIMRHNTIANVESIARTDPRISSEFSMWDDNPWIINTPGGIVDLRTGELSEPRPDAKCTKMTKATPQGICPHWMAFLDTATQGDTDLQGYMQRIAGYTLTGITKEQCIFFMHGKGGNGKSTFLNVMKHILGDYAVTSSMEPFIERKFADHPTEFARMNGARMVCAEETEEGAFWAEAKIKELTGGLPLPARFMRQDFFEFQPEFKLIVAGNNKPRIKSVDEGIKRRMKLIPFTAEIPAHLKDKNLTEKLLAEADGIFAWALQGCLDWQTLGDLKQPTSVTEATDEYLGSEDRLSAWINEECSQNDAFSTKQTDLYKSYKAWAERNDEFKLPKPRWMEQLASKGYKKVNHSNVDVIKGLRLNEHEDSELL